MRPLPLLAVAFLLGATLLTGCADDLVTDAAPTPATLAIGDLPDPTPSCTSLALAGPSPLLQNTVGEYRVVAGRGCDVVQVMWSVTGNGTEVSKTSTSIRVRAGSAASGSFSVRATVFYNVDYVDVLEKTVPVSAPDLGLTLSPARFLGTEVSWNESAVTAAGATSCTLERRATRRSSSADVQTWSDASSPERDGRYMIDPTGPWTATYTLRCFRAGRVVISDATSTRADQTF